MLEWKMNLLNRYGPLGAAGRGGELITGSGKKSFCAAGAVLVFLFLAFAVGRNPLAAQPSCTAQDAIPYRIPVVVIKYFPVKGDRIDQSVTGDWGETLAFTRQKVERITRELVRFLEEGSRFRAYRDAAAPPSLDYQVVGEYEFLEPLPVRTRSGHRLPLCDYRAILQRIPAREWVELKGVKEFWIWGYHGGVLDLWESNMAGPHGDISNSDRDTTDLPVFSRTYTVYHYNYQRGLSEAVENHMHQIEALLNWVDGRDRTPRDQWDQLLFWGKFVGSDSSHRIIRPGCGWAHYPPNGRWDYDWANQDSVWTDIEDWKPDGSGKKIKINCQRWECNSLGWFRYWMQSLPGYRNGLSYQGRPLSNWWIFVGDFDGALQRGIGLVCPEAN